MPSELRVFVEKRLAVRFELPVFTLVLVRSDGLAVVNVPVLPLVRVLKVRVAVFPLTMLRDPLAELKAREPVPFAELATKRFSANLPPPNPLPVYLMPGPLSCHIGPAPQLCHP